MLPFRRDACRSDAMPLLLAELFPASTGREHHARAMPNGMTREN
jgi:hypothetical protein